MRWVWVPSFSLKHKSFTIPHWLWRSCWLRCQCDGGTWTFCEAQLESGRAARRRGKGYSRMSSLRTDGKAAEWVESTACRSDRCQCHAGHWTRWWASSRCQMPPPPETPDGRSCVCERAEPLPGSLCGGRVWRSSAVWRRCTGKRCRGPTEAGHRWWRECCRRRPTAASPGPSRTPHRWWSLHF